MNRNIGGSLLPSSSPEVLRPILYLDGVLQVIPDEAADTHRLFYIKGEKRTELASHPNGHSCHELAKRIIAYSAHAPDKENRLRYLEQAEYIILCCGTVDFVAINRVRIEPLLNRIHREQDK
jgi:hypothetical protein